MEFSILCKNGQCCIARYEVNHENTLVVNKTDIRQLRESTYYHSNDVLPMSRFVPGG